MKNLITLLTIAITLASCSKGDDVFTITESITSSVSIDQVSIDITAVILSPSKSSKTNKAVSTTITDISVEGQYQELKLKDTRDGFDYFESLLSHTVYSEQHEQDVTNVLGSAIVSVQYLPEYQVKNGDPNGTSEFITYPAETYVMLSLNDAETGGITDYVLSPEGELMVPNQNGPALFVGTGEFLDIKLNY